LSAPNLVTLAVGLIVILCVVLVLRRLLMRASPASIREDLTVSRTWLLEHKSRNGSD
jgi:hypothetical protein